MPIKYHIINVQGAIYRDNQFLLAKRSEAEDFMPGVLALPGGKIEEIDQQTSDVLQNTIRREILEEVNVKVTLRQLLTNRYFLADQDPVMNFVFLCEYISGEARAVDLDEVTSVQWMTADSVLQHPNCMSWTRDYIQLAEKARVQLG